MSAIAPRVPVVARPINRLRQAWTRAGAPRPPTYLLLVGLVAVLNIIGLVMVLSASSVTSLDNTGSAWSFFQRELLWVTLGATAFVVFSRLDYHMWHRWSRWLLGGSVAALVLVVVPGVGVWQDGARRWLGRGPIQFQPTEIAKFGLLVFAADLLTRRASDVEDWRRALRPVLIVFFALAALVMMEPDLDTTMVLAVIVVAILVAGGIRVRHLLALGAALVAAASAFALLYPWRRARMLTFLHPWKDPSNSGYQITQSLIALGSGGLTGVGLGASRAKWRFLPAAHTDFIFAIIGEELGLLGALLVVTLFLAFAYLGIRIALRAPDRFGMLMAAGITAWVVGQAIINIGMVVGLLPVSGLPLPFVSYGGTALVFTMFGAGVLANVARAPARAVARPPGRVRAW